MPSKSLLEMQHDVKYDYHFKKMAFLVLNDSNRKVRLLINF